MRVLITGGTGNVGRAAVEHLVARGHEVRVIGRRADVSIEGAEYRPCDVTDYEALLGHMEGIEGVVHLAAIPNPERDPGQEIFRVNCTGTFNVYQAAADNGIRRVVSASSINALGYTYGVKEIPIHYFPIDEDHPTFTTDPYSFSKQVMEETAAYFWRRNGISGVCLRLPWVRDPAAMRRHQEYWKRFPRMDYREAFDALMALPEQERRERVNAQLDRYAEWRERRAQYRTPEEREKLRREYRAHRHHRHRHGYRPTPEHTLVFSGRSDFWAIIDARDSAQAIEKGLTAEYEGSNPIFVNDSHNALGLPSEGLAQLMFPDVKERRRPIEGTGTLVSIDRARELLGFEPQYRATHPSMATSS